MKINNYDVFIKELFEDKSSFYAATDLNDRLCEEFKITSNHARQIILRATNEKNIIKSSAPFTFIKGQYYYMHPSSNVSFPTLFEICKKYKKPLYRLLFLLKKNEGIVSMYEAQKITAAPIKNQDKYKTVSLRKELTVLREFDFITIKTFKETGEQFIIEKSKEDQSDSLIRAHREKMKEDVIFIVDIVRWFSKRGFITGTPIYRNKENPSIGAIINDYLFDVKAFTQATGFDAGKSSSENNKSIVTMDILLYRTYCNIDLNAFYERIQSIRNSTKSENVPRKVMPIVIYQDIEEETKKQLSNLHILHFSLEDILGVNVSHVMKNVQAVRKLIRDSYGLNEEESISIIKTVQKSLTLIEESGQQDNLQNLKGDLFETLLFTVFTSMFIRDEVMHSVRIKNPEEPGKQPYEYDLVILRREEIIIVELKGLKNSTIINWGPKNEKNTVSWFLGKTYPIAKAHYQKKSHLNQSDIKACYITSANFSDDSLIKLEKYNKSNMKSNELDCFYDRKRLLKLLRENKEIKELRETTGFIKTLEKYYLTEEKKK